eukprot:21671-Amphidinium_carterae.1
MALATCVFWVTLCCLHVSVKGSSLQFTWLSSDDCMYQHSYALMSAIACVPYSGRNACWVVCTLNNES